MTDEFRQWVQAVTRTSIMEIVFALGRHPTEAERDMIADMIADTITKHVLEATTPTTSTVTSADG